MGKAALACLGAGAAATACVAAGVVPGVTLDSLGVGAETKAKEVRSAERRVEPVRSRTPDGPPAPPPVTPVAPNETEAPPIREPRAEGEVGGESTTTVPATSQEFDPLAVPAEPTPAAEPTPTTEPTPVPPSATGGGGSSGGGSIAGSEFGP